MEGQTIAYALVDGIVVLAHAEVRPANDEWRQYIAWVRQHTASIEGILVLAAGSGPDPVQREELAQGYLSTFHGKTAIVTRSMVLRGIITVLTWMNRNVKPFENPELALAYLGVDGERADAVLAAAERLASAMKPDT